MKQVSLWLKMFVVLAIFSFPALAEDFKKCEKDFQTCINELVEEYKTRGWVGMSVSNIDGKFAVDAMALEGPAVKAGIQEGDVVVECNGTKINTLIDLAGQHQKFKTGDIVSYKMDRNGEIVEVDVLLTEATANVIGLWIGEHVVRNYLNVDEKTERIIP